MTFRELPTNQKLLFIAHSMVAVAALLTTYANILALTEKGLLPSEIANTSTNKTNLNSTPAPQKGRSGFFE